MTEQSRPYVCGRCRAFTRQGVRLRHTEPPRRERGFLCDTCFNTPPWEAFYNVMASDKGRKAPSGLRVLKD